MWICTAGNHGQQVIEKANGLGWYAKSDAKVDGACARNERFVF
jgi:hypothetical protein